MTATSSVSGAALTSPMGDLLFEQRDRVGGPTRCQERRREIVDGARGDLGEARDFAVSRFLARELFERRPVPLVERGAQGLHSIAGRVRDGAAEPLGVDLGGSA